MTVYAGSRYATQSVVLVTDADGVQHPTIFGPTPTLPSAIAYYQVQAGDRFDTLAARFLGNDTKWWMIADANPQVFFPELLQPGSMLRIPVSS